MYVLTPTRQPVEPRLILIHALNTDPEQQQLPKPLVSMLLFRCPNLEELVIGSTTLKWYDCWFKFDALPLLEATWPKLRIRSSIS